MITLDHIVVSAKTLDEASDHIASSLGVKLQDGGCHDRFATHNRLLGLENGIYLEAIAVNPEAKKPTRPRWRDLDNFNGKPRITNWVCRSKNIKFEIIKRGEFNRPLIIFLLFTDDRST